MNDQGKMQDNTLSTEIFVFIVSVFVFSFILYGLLVFLRKREVRKAREKIEKSDKVLHISNKSVTSNISMIQKPESLADIEKGNKSGNTASMRQKKTQHF